MKPTVVQVIGRELVVGWEDGHESYYGAEFLRKACPCAGCAGEPDLFGRMSRGAQTPTRPESFEIASVERIGNYGLQPNWKDGHSFGIWTWEALRRICPCERCKERRTGEAASPQ
jgi:DUF971 family protein